MKDIKTLKIDADVHRELKIFVAKRDNENMEEAANFAITDYMILHGHKFSKKQKLKK